MTTPMFQTRRDARRFLLGLVMWTASIPLFISAVVIGFSDHRRFLHWFWLTDVAIALLLIGQVIDSGPSKRAIRGAKTRFGLLTPSALRDAFRVARSGPRGKAPLPQDFPQLFADRRSARSFLAGVVFIPVGFLLPLALSIVFAGTSVNHPTPEWVSLFGILAIVGIVFVILPISRFMTRQESLPQGQMKARRSWGLFFSGDGMREALRSARSSRAEASHT